MKCKLLLSALALLSISSAIAQTRQQTENLYTFARLYGYIRYFHPSDAVVVTDWESLAIYGAREAEKATSAKDLQQKLEQLFKTVAPTLRIYATGTNVKLPDLKPADTTGMKVVAWQHNGYGAGKNGQTYRSVRTNSYIKTPAPFQQNPAPAFSTISGSIDAKPYQGRTIRYTAATKAESLSNGTGQLWLRVDRESKTVGFFDNMDNRPVKGISKEWRRDTIIGKIDADAQMVTFGCFIKDKGSMLLDDVKLEIETPEGWKLIPELNGDFEKDTLHAQPGYWKFKSTDQFIVKTTSSKAFSGKQALYLARDMNATPMLKTTTLLTNTLSPGTVIKKDIGSGLSITMPVALWGNGQQTYPFTDTAKANAQNNAIAAQLPDPLTGDNLYVRLAGVIITWNVFQHFHPYYKEWITDWDKDLRTALDNCYKDKTADDFELSLKVFTSKMRDGHTHIASPNTMRNSAWLPLKWQWVENRLLVTRILSPDAPLKPGDVITTINSIPAREYIDNAAKTLSGGSPNALMANAVGSMVYGPKNTALQLTVQNADKSTQQVSLPFSLNPMEYYKVTEENPAYRQIDSNTIYVNISQMSAEEIKAKLPELASSKIVIFDLRGYPKNNGTMIIAHLLKQPEKDKWMQLQQISLPDHENTNWQGIGWNMQPASPHIGGKLFFLTNDAAISYAESVMGYIKDLKLATIVGEPTAGANGDVNTVGLPGNYVFTFTGLKVTNHDGTQHFMKGVQPDVMVHRTIKGVLNNEDEVLAKAIELSHQ